jgi:hypothetical protein
VHAEHEYRNFRSFCQCLFPYRCSAPLVFAQPTPLIAQALVTERLAQAGIQCSVGSTGDSYDNALAETIIELFKTEVIYPRGPWKSIDPVEYATLEWVDWFNHRRLLEPIGNIPPAEYGQAYYRQLEESARAA